MSATDVKLARCATRLIDPITRWKALYDAGDIGGADFFGLYTLAWVIALRGRKFAAGRLAECIVGGEIESTIHSLPLHNFDDVCTLFDAYNSNALIDYLERFHKPTNNLSSSSSSSSSSSPSSSSSTSMSIVSVFNRVRLLGIDQNKKNCVNDAVVRWAAGEWPFELMFSVPTPIQVLEQQARGRRVISVLVGLDELQREHVSPLAYMSGEQTHSKNCISFAVHDCRHMLHFAGSFAFAEQVGVFASLWRCARNAAGDDDNALRRFFDRYSGGDDALFAAIEYAISDMNAVANHILKYVKSKWICADERLGGGTCGGFAAGWPALLERMELPDDVCHIAHDIGAQSTAEEMLTLRTYFADIGRAIIVESKQ
jgi:hypothetical protein